VLVICFIVIILSVPIISAQNETAQNETIETDDSWYDSHWGGDTGNDTFEDPVVVDNSTRNSDGGICTTTYCTSGTIVVGLGFASVITKKRGWLKKRWDEIWGKNIQE